MHLKYVHRQNNGSYLSFLLNLSKGFIVMNINYLMLVTTNEYGAVIKGKFS